MTNDHHIDPAVIAPQGETRRDIDARIALKLYLFIDGAEGEMRAIETDADAACSFYNDANYHAASIAGMADGDIAYYTLRDAGASR